MSTFDVTFPNVAPPQVQRVGEDPVLEVVVPVGFPLPVAGNQAVAAHIGTLRFGLDRDSAIKFFTEGLQQAEDLPPPSKLEVAASLEGVDKAVDRLGKLTGR